MALKYSGGLLNEAGSRYDTGFSVRVDMLKKCLDAVNEWIKQVF